MAKYKIVVAGCGGMSNRWLDYVEQREDAEIVGLVDIFEDAAKAMAEKRSLAVPTFTDLQQALDATDANLVFDITIPASHKQIVSTALKAGRNVFGEKPMAESMADAQEVLELTRSTGKRYSVMQNRRFLKPVRAIRSFLDSGAVGKLGALHADFFIGAHFGGFRDAMDSPLLLDMAIHTFDQARCISGADPVSVYCHEFNPPGSWYKGNASAICIFEMSDGSVFNYRGSWCSEGFTTSWESEWRIIGSIGSVRWDGKSAPQAETVDESQPPAFLRPLRQLEVPNVYDGQEGHPGCLDEMFASLEADRPAETDASDNIKSMAMVFGAIESARTGKKVLL